MQNFLPKNYPHTYNRAASDLSSDAAPCVHEPVYPCVRVPVHPDVRLYRLRANSAARRQPSVLSISPSFSTPGTSTSPAICQPGCGATATAPLPSASTVARSRDAAPAPTAKQASTAKQAPTTKHAPPAKDTAAVCVMCIRRPSGSKASALTGISSAPAVPQPRVRTSTTDIPWRMPPRHIRRGLCRWRSSAPWGWPYCRTTCRT